MGDIYETKNSHKLAKDIPYLRSFVSIFEEHDHTIKRFYYGIWRWSLLALEWTPILTS